MIGKSYAYHILKLKGIYKYWNEVYKSYNILKFWRYKILENEKSINEEIQEFYLNGGKYNEEEIDFGKREGSELL